MGQTSDSARLVMKRKPRIEAELTKTAERGKDVLLSCKVRNTFPGTEMVWANKGQPLEIISDKFNEISSDLVITNVDSEDFKEYGCFASNELGSDYQTIKLVEETSPASFVITVIVNSMGGVAIIILCVWLWFRRRKSNVEFMEEQKRRNYLNDSEIYKNVDRGGIFDKLLKNNDLIVKNDNFNINMEFEEEEGDPDYQKKISETGRKFKQPFRSISLSPNDSVASSRTVLSFLEDSP